MSELTAAGYQTLKDYVNSSSGTPNAWDYIEIYDDAGNPVTRVSITGDGRCSWGDADGDNLLQITFDVTGSDGDISTPVTLQKSAIWNASSGGSQCTAKEQFANATLNQAGDNVTITHSINIPQ
jgi:hypothetical protein